MARIIVNPDSAHAWEIELKPGPNILGRGEGSDFIIDHPSVSTKHCQITVRAFDVTIKDLGSVTGTYINTALVEEGRLQIGDLLRLGDVWMRIDRSVEPAAPQMLAETASPAPAISCCKIHPKAAATYHCAKCAGLFCDLCVVTRMVQGQTTRLCRECGGECAPLQPEEVVAAPKFSRLIGGAFTFPFCEDGVMVLVGGAIFFSVMAIVMRFLFGIGIFVAIFLAGYLVTFFQGIIRNSAAGDEKMPDWPDVTDWMEMVGPFWQCLCTQIVSFGPVTFLILMKLHQGIAAPSWMPWAIVAATLWGCLIFPIGFLAVTMFDSVAALNPLVLIPSMFRIAGAYLLAVVLCGGIFLANTLGQAFVETVIPIPFIPLILSEFLSLYLLMVSARVLGLLYWCKQDELRWFTYPVSAKSRP